MIMMVCVTILSSEIFWTFVNTVAWTSNITNICECEFSDSHSDDRMQQTAMPSHAWKISKIKL